MKPVQVQKAVDKYRTILIKMLRQNSALAEPERADTSRLASGIPAGMQLRHLLWMCNEIDTMLEVPSTFPSWKEWEGPGEPTMGKVFRWLGFIQGALFSLDLLTIDELRADNRS